MPFQDLVRSGSEQGLLLDDRPRWRVHREMRANTSHTCDEQKALEVVAVIPGFLTETTHLRDELKRRQP